jgi:hypothetical protein
VAVAVAVKAVAVNDNDVVKAVAVQQWQLTVAISSEINSAYDGGGGN